MGYAISTILIITKMSPRRLSFVEGTLMQIWKAPYMFVFIQNQYPENFAILIPGILKLFAREFCKFLKK